jgi:hypothetical protein
MQAIYDPPAAQRQLALSVPIIKLGPSNQPFAISTEA